MQREKLLQFSYMTELKFSQPVRRHQFTLRMIPRSDERQKISECKIDILPECKLTEGEDTFGNKYVYGEIEHLHESFSVRVHGMAHIKGEAMITTDKSRTELAAYRFQSQYTKEGDRLEKYYLRHKQKECEDSLSFVTRLMHQIYEDMEYVQGVTDIHTTAEEALMGGRGVCQDYAHIMLSLCRMADIPSRYVVGMMKGEGYSHAWVEACIDNIWYGFDPTNNKMTDDTYIRISHGRDYQDCIVNRGVFMGNGSQTQKISVIVAEMEN